MTRLRIKDWDVRLQKWGRLFGGVLGGVGGGRRRRG